MDVMIRACIGTPHISDHGSSRLGHEQICGSSGHPLAVLVEHTEEAIVSSRLTPVIPLLSMTSYLMGVVKLKGQKRIDNLGEVAWFNSRIRQHGKSREP